MKSYLKYGIIFLAILGFLFVVGLEMTLAQQTFTYEGSVASISTHAFGRGMITVKGKKGDAMNFALGRKTVYIPSRYPGVGERVKITYSLIKGQNAAYRVESLAMPAAPPAKSK